MNRRQILRCCYTLLWMGLFLVAVYWIAGYSRRNNLNEHIKPHNENPPEKWKEFGKNPPEKWKEFGKNPPEKWKEFGKNPPEKWKEVGKTPPEKWKEFGKNPPEKWKEVGKNPPEKWKEVGKNPPEKWKEVGKNPPEKWKEVGKNISADTNDNIVLTRRENSWIVDHEVCRIDDEYPEGTLRSPYGSTPIYLYDGESRNAATITGQIFQFGVWERYNVEAIYHALSTDRDLIFIDIGANIGVYALSVAMVGRKVIAIEPMSDNVARLCQSIIAGNFQDNIYVIHNAVSDSSKQVSFIDDNDDHSLTKIDLSVNKPSPFSGVCTTLDELLEIFPIQKVVIKMDVESHEGRVLAGAEGMFKQVDVRYVLLEWEHVKKLLDGQFLLEFMKNNGMKPFDVFDYYKPLQYEKNMTWPESVLWKKMSPSF